MEATRDDIEGLFELQRIDLEIKRLSKELDELPQRGIIAVSYTHLPSRCPGLRIWP